MKVSLIQMAIYEAGPKKNIENVLAWMNPGELLLLPNIGYPDYLSSVALGKIEYETYPLKEENNFLPDLSAIPEETVERIGKLGLFEK